MKNNDQSIAKVNITSDKNHVASALTTATGPDFSHNFSDVTLAFSDGSVAYYKSLLALVSPWLQTVLLAAPLSSLIILADTTRDQFILEYAGEMAGEAAYHIDEAFELEDSSEPVDITDDGTVEEEDASDPAGRLVERIAGDFEWPGGLEAPNFHRMRWRDARGQMIEVKGNKSLFVTLTEKCPDIPESAAFSIEGTQVW